MSDIANLTDISVADTAEHDDAVGDGLRLLGRLLGDAIEQTDGTAILELVDQVRQIAVDARRTERSDVDDIRTALAEHPLLERSLRIRHPYLDPLHVMQVDLLRRFREGDDDELVVRGIQLSINAIATGLRNSG